MLSSKSMSMFVQTAERREKERHNGKNVTAEQYKPRDVTAEQNQNRDVTAECQRVTVA